MCEVALETNSLEIWIPAIVSIVTLLLNLMFYIFVQPRLTYKATAKESLKKVSVEFMNYIAEIISYEDFNNVPTRIRQYSLQIHMHFKKGTAKGRLDFLMERIFKEVKIRKELTSVNDIDKWNDQFRNLARDLRKELAKHCGAL